MWSNGSTNSSKGWKMMVFAIAVIGMIVIMVVSIIIPNTFGNNDIDNKYYHHDMNYDAYFSDTTTSTTASNTIYRYLASSSSTTLSKYKIDYNVLSVAAMTLALIMMVEYIRHQLDHYAAIAASSKPNSKPLFRAVLEGVYAELATLGIVEFVLHLIEEYYPSYDKARKTVFADVHFLLFYTAIINAMLSIITAIVVTYISKQLWINTELLELYHYTEIQQTFQQIQNELNTLHHNNKSKKKILNEKNDENDSNDDIDSNDDLVDQNGNYDNYYTTTTGNQKTKTNRNNNSSVQNDPEVGNNNNNNNNTNTSNWDPFDFGPISLQRIYTSILDHIKYPNLKHQYDILLSQIRFHELRNHIITSYNLPKSIQISQYLMRSEQMVLMKLVNVSSMSWLLLTTTICILYYILGMVFYKYMNQTLIGTALIYIYYSWMIVFVIICYIVSNKMKNIFYKLLHSTELWNITTTNTIQKEELSKQQLELFWYNDPSIVIKLIQFMQFGYAVALSTIIVFYDNINDGTVAIHWYIITLFFAYLLYVYVTGHVIPRYTLCTCLGQLVNEQRLRETVALHRLEEEKQKEIERNYNYNEQQQQQQQNNNNSYIVLVHNNNDPSTNFSNNSNHSITNHTNSSIGRDDNKMKTIDDNGDDDSDDDDSDDDEQIMTAVQQQQSTATTTVTKTINDINNDNDTINPMNNGVDNNITTTTTTTPNNNLTNQLDGSLHTNDITPIDTTDITSLLPKKNLENSITIENDIMNGTKNHNDDSDDDDDFDENYCSYAENRIVSGRFNNNNTNGDTNNIPSTDQKRDLKVTPTNHSNHTTMNQLSSSSYMYRLCKWLHSYFTSERHIEVSNVYGAIIAFFFVGQRVEGFIHSEGIVSSEFLSFHYRLDVTFWLLSSWLCMFIFASMLIIVLLWYFDDFQTIKGYTLGTAALIDAIIAGTCLVVFFVAEIQRCCISDTDITEVVSHLSYSDTGSAPCSCPTFGKRLYGGIGTIEPYVSLILLRVLRHYVARKVIGVLHKKYNWPKIQSNDDDEQQFDFRKRKSTNQIMKFGGHTLNHMNTVSIVTEMWEATISANPDIAAKHGEFSGEILRAMLGLSPLSENNIGSTDTPHDVVKVNISDPTRPVSNQVFALETKYSKLSPEAQEVILAGKLGQSMVRSTSFSSTTSSLPVSRNSLTRNQSVMFELKTDRLSHNHDNESDYNFISPNARLLHSMRRCDRKFLPLLEKWATVDVIITRFEIVYLDVTDDENNVDPTHPDCIREALQATKGGKGLRLCDVVSGRSVVGRVGFSDITSLHVERLLPYGDDDDDAHMSNDSPVVEVESNEYWQFTSKTKSRPSLVNPIMKPTRTQEWNHIKEDHLKIETLNGTLILRFFADLEDAKHHPEHLSADLDTAGSIFKNNALQWVQTIANLCGPEQLTKQQLPHFGENTSEEIRDYMVIIDRKKRMSHRRILSDGGEYMMSFRRSFRGVSRPNLINRVMSMRFVSTDTTSPPDRPSPRQFLSGPMNVSSNGAENSSSIDVLPAWSENNNNNTIAKPDAISTRKVSFATIEE